MPEHPESPSAFLNGPRILPGPLRKGITASDLMDEAFLAYNAGRLHDGARLLAQKVLRPEVTVGLTLTGALTPAGLGRSCLVPLIQHGLVDWIVSTGANLYHDTHFALDLALHRGSPGLPDATLRDEGVVRIYDILFDYRVLLDTDAFYRELIKAPAFQRPMSTAEFHSLAGRAVHEREQALGLGTVSMLSAAYLAGVPIYTSSPGDSSIGMNVAAMALEGNGLQFDVNADVNESAAIVLDAKLRGGRSAVWILGGGSPKNFILQTEPQIQEVLGIDERGHDFFLQITDARPDTGGLSGATPAEAVSWGKIDPDQLPDTVVCYTDSTLALPLLTAYVLDRVGSRPMKRLADRRVELLDQLKAQYRTRGRLSGQPTTAREPAGRGTWPCGTPKEG
ncbi:MAG: deoxyhypusine synthase [Acidobacteria bacterium]|nr:deoxyhypusine synthase [Acidobacteriota bacterium]